MTQFEGNSNFHPIYNSLRNTLWISPSFLLISFTFPKFIHSLFPPPTLTLNFSLSTIFPFIPAYIPLFVTLASFFPSHRTSFRVFLSSLSAVLEQTCPNCSLYIAISYEYTSFLFPEKKMYLVKSN